jgi:high-affinity iron transporter
MRLRRPALGSRRGCRAPLRPGGGDHDDVIQLFQPMAHYTEYVSAQLVRLHGQLAALNRTIASGSLTATRPAWLAAHLTWLEIGQDDGAYGAFGTLGDEIDGTSAGDVGGIHSAKFTGFHRVELDLFRTDDLTTARVDAAKLTSLVKAITTRTLEQDLAVTPLSLDAWVLRCHEILEDALRDSLSGNDDYGSNTDLADVGADVSATDEMLSVLSGLIEPRAPGLVTRGTAELAAIDAAIRASHSPGTAWREPAALPLRSRQRLDAAVGAALETLAPVSELMQISGSVS